MADPSPLERALEGDRDAEEQVVGAIVAPIWDVACHLTGDEVMAVDLVRQSLHGLVNDIRDDDLAVRDALVVTMMHVVEQLEGVCDWWDDSEAGGRYDTLDAESRVIIVIALAADLEPAGIGAALHLSADRIQDILTRARATLGDDDSMWRVRLDARAAVFAIPAGLVEDAVA